ncbi:iron complex transport system substrate-binding protein [Yokenella regensburgei]|uniref:Iron complex transport system substrate-binding protein n=1 Tax=Yokenella regensburgei TaxID=158877 RepID=A0ABX9RSM0_9ENTR|nr:ABC transporter substrate-binding protein [Yokenella regensburgei]RKR52769.1 iron complex transport system substrate-binding protein [Yokenella regensburgei]VFS35480.1 iron-dicitrate transporter substrate-binding subunit [Yokenella regensburgei]
MPITRRLFAQAMASALLLAGLPVRARSSLSYVMGTLPAGNNIRRVVSAGAPADLLMLAVAPEKLLGLSSFDLSQPPAGLFPEQIRQLKKLGRLAGRASTLSLEGLMALHPDLVVDCGNADETWLSQARQISRQTQIPWLLLDGALRQTPEQLNAVGEALGVTSRTTAQAQLAGQFIQEAETFAQTSAAGLRFYAARGARGLETGLQGSLHTEAAELLGLRNVARITGRSGLTQVSMENLLSWQPDIILVQDPVTARYLREDPVWQGVKAVKAQRILFLHGLPFGWLDAPPGINRLLGLRRLHAWLSPAVEQRFQADMTRYAKLFWHTSLSDAQYKALVENG